MVKIQPLECKSVQCKGQVRNYEYVYDRVYLNGQKLYEIFTCSCCKREEGLNFTEFYWDLVGVKKK